MKTRDIQYLENQKLKDYIFDKFMKNHKYITNGKTFDEFMNFYFNNGFKEYDELEEILGYHDLIKRMKKAFNIKDDGMDEK